MKNIDLIHIGFHKTASTWLQMSGFQRHPQIVLANDEASGLMEDFMKSFVEVPTFNFDRAKFENEFSRRMNEVFAAENQTAKFILSEENLSGHYWNGAHADSLMLRLKEVFPSAKILIVLRKQEDMILSLYSNYIKMGGTRPFSTLLEDDSIWGSYVIEKLCYDKLIWAYMDVFGKENVKVVTYESFQKNVQKFLDDIASFMGLPPFPTLSKADFSKKINRRVTVFSEGLFRLMNFFTNWYLRRGFRKLPTLLDFIAIYPSKTKRLKVLEEKFPMARHKWRESNKRVQEITGIDLQSEGYDTDIDSTRNASHTTASREEAGAQGVCALDDRSFGCR